MALLAAAGARRSASAFERLEQETLASDVLVNPNSEESTRALTPERLRADPEVEAAYQANGIVAVVDRRVTDTAFLAGVDGTWFTGADRPVVREGRLPDQSRADELFANPDGAASLGLRVGDEIALVTVSSAELPDQPGSTEDLLRRVDSGQMGRHMTARLVGVGVTAGDVVPGGQLASIFLTSGFTEQTGTEPIFGGIGVRLKGGSGGTDGFIERARAMAPDSAATDFQTLDADRATVQRSVRPVVIALGAFAAALAAGAVLAVAQALGRRASLSLDDEVALHALGMTRPERRLVDWMRLGSVTVAGTALAVVIAASASPLTPVGLARSIEPTPGWSIDWLVLVGGALLLAILVVGFGALAMSTSQRLSRAPRSSVVVASLRRHLSNVPVVTGVGMALESGRGRTSVPARSTLITALVGVMTVVASLTFAAGLDRLVSSPRAFGSDFDAYVTTGDESDVGEPAAVDRTMELLDSLPGVVAWSQLYSEQVQLPAGDVPADGLVLERGDAARPTLVRGRLPTGLDEVALGATTMRREGVDIGDRITVRHGSDDSAVTFDIVGQVVLPGIANYAASDQPALGVGALFSADGLGGLLGVDRFHPGDSRPGDSRPGDGDVVPADPEAPGLAMPTGLLVRLDDRIDVAELSRRVTEATGPGVMVVTGPSRPSDIESLVRIRSTPLLLAGLLGLLAAVSVGHALVVSVRRRRFDLALLRSIGLTPGQAWRAVSWQATTVAVVAGVVGIPLGVVLGRVAWAQVADGLGVVKEPVIPWLTVVLVVPVAAAFANLVAFVPGLRAARVRLSPVLRAE